MREPERTLVTCYRTEPQLLRNPHRDPKSLNHIVHLILEAMNLLENLADMLRLQPLVVKCSARHRDCREQHVPNLTPIECLE